MAKLALGALGVVYGDIGTSPLYALRDCVNGPHGVAPTAANVVGLLSLMFWSLVFIVVVKYLVFVLRADNDGEGGILALLALLMPSTSQDGEDASRRRFRGVLVCVGLIGAALLYGDGMITPALTVLSAVEGLQGSGESALAPFIVPITCAILVGVFALQSKGTAGIGKLFGPAMIVWFVCIGATGARWVVRRPEVLLALSPTHAVTFFMRNGLHGFLVLGTVVLCVAGCEALYADMGHFGRRAIRMAWFCVAFPGLLLNYLGQGALLLEHPEAAASPFYALVEGPLRYPMVVIATAAGIIASQALISGAFSVTRQAIQLGYVPRLTIVHTSATTQGQIYIPEVNHMLALASITVVIAFQQSQHLTAAYGIAVTGTMTMTSLLFLVAVRERWGWRRLPAFGLVGLFLVADLGFLGSNLAKIPHGGWLPLAIAGAFFVVMTTWKRGREVAGARIDAASLPLELFLADIQTLRPYRVRGTAIFLTSMRRGTPLVLLHHFKHNKALHEQVVILTITTDDVPEVPRRHRIQYEDLGQGFWKVTARYGFLETPNAREVLRLCRVVGIPIKEADTSYYLGRETLVAGNPPAMASWRRQLFSFLSRNSRGATDFFGIPPNRAVELGAQIEL